MTRNFLIASVSALALTTSAAVAGEGARCDTTSVEANKYNPLVLAAMSTGKTGQFQLAQNDPAVSPPDSQTATEEMNKVTPEMEPDDAGEDGAVIEQEGDTTTVQDKGTHPPTEAVGEAAEQATDQPENQAEMKQEGEKSTLTPPKADETAQTESGGNVPKKAGQSAPEGGADTQTPDVKAEGEATTIQDRGESGPTEAIGESTQGGDQEQGDAAAAATGNVPEKAGQSAPEGGADNPTPNVEQQGEKTTIEDRGESGPTEAVGEATQGGDQATDAEAKEASEEAGHEQPTESVGEAEPEMKDEKNQ